MSDERVTYMTGRNKGGRPTSYTEDMPERLVEHFRIDLEQLLLHNFTTAGKSNLRMNPKILPSITKFCEEVGITTTTLHDWRAKHKEFADAYAHARMLYEDLIVTLGFTTNSTFSVFMLKANFGYRDNTEIVVKGDDTKPVRLKIVSERPKQDGEQPKEQQESVDWGDD